MKPYLIPCLVAVALLCGYFLGSRQEAPEVPSTGTPTVWTCSMHPQVRLPEEGLCPICGMELIPEDSASDAHGTGPVLTLSPSARKMAEIETAVVERRPVSRTIRLIGTVAYDEPGLRWISARVGGRLDRLYVDYTGIPVEEGDHLVDIYSPELLQAQRELTSAFSSLSDAGEGPDRRFLQANLDSVREKLRRWGLSEDQIAAMERSGQPSEHVTIHSPISGVVVQKDAIEGMYVKSGSNIYLIADLARVWVLFDAYEADLAWLRYGQEVEFRTDAHPGRVFRGPITFLDPVLDTRTRTLKVRVVMDNDEALLKPDMLVRGVVHARLAHGGGVMESGFSGKWISPMHPEIIKDAPGICDRCGMDLVSAESLGYVDEAGDNIPLVIPASAPLLTGERAVVYVETEPGRYEGRQVELGPLADDHYLVESGLSEGERVVVRGNFRIDSALQIQARPSMMNPPPPPPESLGELLSLYLATREELARDTYSLAPRWEALHPLPAPWKNLARDMADDSLPAARTAFARLSSTLVETLRGTGPPDRALHLFHCPMAGEGRGAVWLQEDPAILNPYFGAGMLKCGTLRETLVPAP